jgi:predicted permease
MPGFRSKRRSLLGGFIAFLIFFALPLVLLGAAVGLLFAFWIKSSLLHFFMAQEVGFNLEVPIDLRVMVFTLALAVITTFLCGLFPAWLAGRVHPLAGLKDNRSQTAPRLRIGKTLIAIQMALSVFLVLGTGLLIQTLINLRQVDPGFDVENLLTFRVNPGQAGYQNRNRVEFYRQVQEAVAGVPGTRSVALSSRCLISGGMEGGGFSILGRNDLSQSQTQAHMLTVSDTFLETMGIGLLAGRNFNQSDSDTNTRVVIVNETFAKTFFPEGNVLGQIIKRIRTEYLIVGLCRDTAYVNLRQTVPPTLYFPFTQRVRGRMTFNVRSVIPPLALVPTIRKRLAEIDPHIPLEKIASQEQIVQDSLSMERLFTTLCSCLTFLALSLSCIGLYGLLAYNVTHRTNEMGIRMAFGARPRDIATPILREAVVLAFVGITAGIPIALAITRLAQSAFFGIQSYDPITVIGSILLLVTVALLAAWFPATRAAKIDPMEALRYE